MLTPDQFADTPVYTLLTEAASGRIGIDQRWYKAILDRGEAAAADLVRFGTEDHESDPIALDEDLLLLFHKLRTPAAVPFFIEYLKRSPEGVSDVFLDALMPVRQEMLEPLIQLYDELSEDDAGEVAFALAAFRIRDERVLQILLDRFEYDTGDGALCLGLYGDPAAKPAMEKMLAEVEDEHLKSDIADAIAQLGREDEEASQELMIEDFVPAKSFPEFEILDEADLLHLLTSSDPEYRFAAASGFINQEKSETALAKLLEQAQTDPDATVRAKCWEALGTEVGDNEPIFQAMLQRLQDESVSLEERVGALSGLGQRANEEPIRKYAEEFYENPETRAAALSAMWNSLDRSFAHYFPPHVADPDLDVRKQAISGIGYLAIHESANKLRDYFMDADLRSNALFAYALAVKAEITPGRVRALLRKIEEAAGSLTEEEAELVQMALDERLLLNGHKPVFRKEIEGEESSGHAHHHHDHGHNHSAHAHAEAPPAAAASAKVGRNDPCPCGSGKKYKKCHGAN